MGASMLSYLRVSSILLGIVLVVFLNVRAQYPFGSFLARHQGLVDPAGAVPMRYGGLGGGCNGLGKHLVHAAAAESLEVQGHIDVA